MKIKVKSKLLSRIIVSVSLLAGVLYSVVDLNTVTDSKTEHGSSPQVSQAINEDELVNKEYDGVTKVVLLNNNKTSFSNEELDLTNGSWQKFSELDSVNRVGVADALLGKELMPSIERERLNVKPTGYKSKKVAIAGQQFWLYNRCHLIGFQLTGENNNLKNLMTGTHTFNQVTMVHYENEVASYISRTGNHVRYRVTPVFKENELVARGLKMEAKSIEDSGIEFNVYLFNVEDGVAINYSNGTSRLN